MNFEFIRGIGASKWLYRTAVRQTAKRLLRRGVSIRLPTGLRMKIPRYSLHGTEVFVTDADTDWGSEALLASFASRDKDFLDVGAHIGYYSLYLSPLVRKAFAFEPDPRIFAALGDNLCAADNIEHIAMAVSNRDGIVHLDVSGDVAISSVCAATKTGSIAVAATTIDTFSQQRPEICVGSVKIDVEGHDVAVLEGGRQTLANHQPLILIEFGQGNPAAELNNPKRLIEFCDSLGYVIFAFTHLGRRKYRNVLIRLRIGDFSTTRLKMLFLVPPGLQANFSQMAVE